MNAQPVTGASRSPGRPPAAASPAAPAPTRPAAGRGAAPAAPARPVQAPGAHAPRPPRERAAAPPPSPVQPAAAVPAAPSAEDEKEFIGDIEKAAAEGRIQVAPDTFTLRPQRGGAVFPVLINAFFLVLLVAGIGTFGLFFGAEERSLVQEQTAFTTTEGRLIEELKRESQEQLQAKEREIGQIQDRLSRLDQERRDLESSITMRIQGRESELRAALQQELAGERERLRGQGISEDDIAARMRTVEAQKSQEYSGRLAAFRAQAEDERRRAEENLRVMQAEYSKSLQGLNRERDQLAQDSRRREDDLRAQLDSRTRSLETEKSTIERQLARIAEERQKEDLVASQLNGLYAGVREQMAAASYDPALQTLANIRAYLGQDGIAQLPAVAKRRDVELFVVDSLTRLVEMEKGRGATDTASLVEQSLFITDLRQTVAAADAAAGRGNLAEAERLYRRAIALVPDIEKSYTWLTSQRQQGDTDRQARLDGLLAQGEAAYAQAQNDRALAFYRQALEVLPADAAAKDRMLARVQAIGYNQGVARDRAGGAAAAAAPLAEARGLLAQDRYAEAVAAYVDALSRQPAAAQTREAIDGINHAVALQKTGADKGNGLQQQLSDRLAEIEALKREIAARDSRLDDARGQIERLQASLQALKDNATPAGGASPSDRDSLAAERDRLVATIDALNAELTALRSADRQSPASGGESAGREEMQRLLRIEKSFTDLQQTYRRYAAAEDEILRSQGAAGMLETKLKLDAFLTSDAMDEFFPGLWNRIKKYDRAFQDVGRDVAIQDLADIVYDLTLFDTPAARARHLDAQIKASSTDAPMVALLNELKRLVD